MSAATVMNPVLLEMGLPPIVSSATSMYMVMLVNMLKCVMFTIYGQLNLPYCLWLTFWNLIGTYIGYSQFMDYIKQSGR